MAAEKQITIRIVGDASNVKAVFNDADKSAGGLGTTLGGVAKIAGGFVVAQALTQLPNLLGSAAGKAVSLEQNAKKAATVFGDELGDVEAWAESAASGMGLTNSEAVTLAAGMADLLIPMGLSREAAAEMSTETIGLAGALSEWSGGQTSAAEAADILTKAYLGETDGLKALGISISAADVSARLAAKGQDELTGAARQQAEALAIQELIFEKSTDAQNAYAEGADSTARKQAEATAAMKTAQEQISVALLPAITLLTTGFATLATLLATTVVPAIIGAVQAFVSFISPIAGFVQDNLGPLLAGLAGIAAAIMVTVLPALAAWVIGMVPVIASHVTMAIAVAAAYAPIIAVMLAVGIAVAALYMAWESNLFGIQDITKQVIDFIWPYIQTAMDGIKAIFEVVWPIIATVVTTYIAILKKEIEIGIAVVRTVFETVFPIIQGIVETVFPIIVSVIETSIGAIKTAFDIIGTVVSTVVGWFQWLYDTLVGNSIIPEMADAITGVIQTLHDLVVGIFGAIKDTIVGIVTAMKDAVVGVIQAMADLVHIIKQSIVENFELVWSGIKTTAETMWDGIKSVVSTSIEAVRSTIETVLGAIRTLFDTVFVPVQGIVSDVWETIKGLTSTAIDKVKEFIGGLLTEWNRVWGAIKGTIDTLWNGATGAVELIRGGLQTAKDVFIGIYDTFFGFGETMMQGLIDGINLLLDPLRNLVSEIGGLLEIDVPGFSPPGEAGYEQGKQFIEGLTDGIRGGLPAYEATVGAVAGAMNMAAAPTYTMGTNGLPQSPGVGTMIHADGSQTVLDWSSGAPVDTGIVYQPGGSYGQYLPPGGASSVTAGSGIGQPGGNETLTPNQQAFLAALGETIERTLERGMTNGTRLAWTGGM